MSDTERTGQRTLGQVTDIDTVSLQYNVEWIDNEDGLSSIDWLKPDCLEKLVDAHVGDHVWVFRIRDTHHRGAFRLFARVVRRTAIVDRYYAGSRSCNLYVVFANHDYGYSVVYPEQCEEAHDSVPNRSIGGHRIHVFRW